MLLKHIMRVRCSADRIRHIHYLRGADIWDPPLQDEYTDTYYSRTRLSERRSQSLRNKRVDVAVIGAGFAGVNVAYSLATRGARVAVLENNRIGWAATGRNGGFAHPGFSLDLVSLANKVGKDHARLLWDLTFESLDTMRARMHSWKKQGRLSTMSSVQEGMIVCSWFNDRQAVRDEVDTANDILRKNYFSFVDRETVRQKYNTNKYYDALYDPESFHFHSLNYALEVAKDASDLGAEFHESTRVHAIERSSTGSGWQVHSNNGSLLADQIVYCGSAYIPGVDGLRKIAQAVLPVMTYACVTEPLGDKLKDVIRAPHAVTDNRFACDYYRPLPDTRILWGGRIDCMGIAPDKLAAVLHADMCKVYPQLKDVKVEVAWPGVMGYARHKMPLIGRVEPTLWYCTGFGGHGVCPTTIAGEVVAGAVTRDGDQRYQLFKPFGLEFTGGPYLGAAAAQTFYWWYTMRDHIRSRLAK